MSTFSSRNLDVSRENVFLGQVSSRLVLGITDNDASNGIYVRYLINFENYRQRQMTLQFDEQEKPIKSLQLDFTTGKVSKNDLEAYFKELKKLLNIKTWTFQEKAANTATRCFASI